MENCTAGQFNIILHHMEVIFSQNHHCIYSILRPLYRQMGSRILNLLNELENVSARDVAKKVNLLNTLHLVAVS